jgi:hypothetical protein
MARFSRVPFSNQTRNLIEIATHHSDVEDSLRSAFVPESALIQIKYPTDTPNELRSRLANRLEENDVGASMNVLASIEASFRVDYLTRRYKRMKDNLSRAMRDLYRSKGDRATLEEDIFETWKLHSSVPFRLISELRAAFRYRHWIAHGRYWIPKLGRKYDFFGINVLAQTVVSSVPFEQPD